MDKVRDLSEPNFPRPAIRPSGVIGTTPVFPDTPPKRPAPADATHVRPVTADMPKQRREPSAKRNPARSPGRPKRQVVIVSANGYFTDANGKRVYGCGCDYVYTGQETIERFERAKISVVICPECKGGLVIAEGSSWTPNKD